VSRLGDLTWPEVAAERPVLVVPLGSLEQHGPHLPLDTDTRIATAVAASLAETSIDSGVVVAPPVVFGASGEHAGFPGTLSIGQDALELLVVELVRSADHFSGVVLVNGHGGNGATLRRAVDRLRGEGRRVLLVHCGVPDGDPHAGRTETSLLLHLAPGAVHLDRAEAGDTRPWPDLAAQVAAGGVAAVSANGVLGDPAGASAAEGEVLLASICGRVRDEVAGWAHD
jgi:creatinine amidohydrolase